MRCKLIRVLPSQKEVGLDGFEKFQALQPATTKNGFGGKNQKKRHFQLWQKVDIKNMAIRTSNMVTPKILALGRQRQEDHNFKVILGFTL